MRYDITVVMVSHNDLNEVCLNSLKRAIEQSPLKIGVVIVDNQSTTYEANAFVAQYLPEAVVLLRNGDFGYGRSCNRGAKELDSDYLLILNPDSALPDPKIFDTLHNFLKTNPKAGIIAPKVLYFDERLQETCRRFPAWYMPIIQRTPLKNTDFGKEYIGKFTMIDFDHNQTRMVDWAQGSALFISQKLFQELNGFDDQFWMYFEDIDLCRRSWQLGRPVYYLPEAVIHHAYGRESAKVPGLFRNILTNQLARAHITSWLKYQWKWLGVRPI